ncbi:pitrilysin family protein [Conexibacter sp. DBS9H8]|uniref:M16 family metallopeptidase n=1 Tax=Conexibacter sp. DBS9H8 TaxID=2937801 RepID=UPI00200D4098|nr:pitrilysin family protein [Conexibacter sp. DBS9H8]
MSTITSTPLANGLVLHRLPRPGTQSVTVLVAFDAGARTEAREENGMAHFLEHLVFKGGEKFGDYRAVNEAAEHAGAVLNAYTSHDLVAFHITARATKLVEAADLLSDFVARPRIDPAELEKERGVVIQEIARYADQPASVAEHLVDAAVFGDHPLGRPVLGPAEHLRDTFTREGILAFRARRWVPSAGAAFIVGDPAVVGGPEADAAAAFFERFEAGATPPPVPPAPAFAATVQVSERDSAQSHLRMSYRPSIDVRDPRQRAALTIYATLLGGSMGSRLFDEIREQRGLAYSVGAYPHAHADVPVLQLSAGLQSDKATEAFTRMREVVSDLREHGPRPEEVERARNFAAGARAIAFENTNAIARNAAAQVIVFSESADPDAVIARLDAVTVEEVREVAAGIADELVVACVGPHRADDFPLD